MLRPLSTAQSRQFREFLIASAYSDAELAKRPVLAELPSRQSGNLPMLLDYTSGKTSLDLLLRLFLFGQPANQQDVAGAIPEPILAICLDCGLLEVQSESFAATVMLTPLDQFWFASDPAALLHSGFENLIIWPNQTTRAIARFCQRKPVESTLDFGSGNGVLSVIASQWSRRVVATDINPRAAEFTAFNASLNGVDNIVNYTGDAFGPLGDQQFDLILANPPFFVTPAVEQVYCDNSMELDEFCRHVVRKSPLHLREGGYLQMTFEFVQVKGERWQDRLAEWVEGSGCDVWILRGYFRDIRGYAYERLKSEYSVAPEATTEKYNRWLAYYREKDIEQVCGGFLIMRRRQANNWLRIEDAAIGDRGSLADTVSDAFETQTLLNDHPGDEELLQLRPRVHAEARLDQESRVSEGRWVPASLQLNLSSGLPSTLPVEFAVADFVARCDGSRTLAEMAAELSAEVKAPLEQVRAQCCSVVRKLAERRFLRLS
jgi:methylase of polypeptide subunit release factors